MIPEEDSVTVDFDIMEDGGDEAALDPTDDDEAEPLADDSAEPPLPGPVLNSLDPAAVTESGTVTVEPLGILCAQSVRRSWIAAASLRLSWHRLAVEWLACR